MHKVKSERMVRGKILYTALILLVYLIGRNVPLYGIDTAAYHDRNMDSQLLLMQAIGGDQYRYSLLALGVMPYMLSSVLIQIIMALRQSDSKAKISPRLQNQIQLAGTMFIALIQAALHLGDMLFLKMNEKQLLITKSIVVIELLAGVMLVLWLSERNKKWGIGGQTALILVNIVDGIVVMIKEHVSGNILIPLLVSVAVMMLMLLMENTENRIPVQRISIHNIYADKNYLSVKLNPIGVMPIMFSSAVFALPQLILAGLHILFPENAVISLWQECLVLTDPVGIAVYIVVIYVLTIGFSLLFINAKDLTEQFLKSGDSLVNLHAGKETRRYLRRTLLWMSFVSATVMSACVAVPMLLQLNTNMDSLITMMPTSFMMLTGIWCNLYREYIAVKSFEEYKPFI